MSVKTFEKDMSRLEEIVSLLESGKCTLEESMLLFEEGVKLTKSCNETLENAKQKLTIFSDKENGEE